MVKRKKINKPKNLNGFMNYILFHPQAYSILMGISYLMGLAISIIILSIGFVFAKWYIILIGVFFTFYAVRNVWKQRLIFKAFKRKGGEFVNDSVANTLNDVIGAKKE